MYASSNLESNDTFILSSLQCFDEWEAVLKLLRQNDETDSSESTDTPEHRRRGISQTGSIEPSTSLISNDMLIPRDTEEELERDDHAETVDQSDSTRPKEETEDSGGNGRDPGRQNVTQLPGLFDEDDPESNELFGSTS